MERKLSGGWYLSEMWADGKSVNESHFYPRFTDGELSDGAIPTAVIAANAVGERTIVLYDSITRHVLRRYRADY